MPIHIIGIGSPFGDDRLGWVAAEQLRQSRGFAAFPPGSISISTRDRPGVLLAPEWEAAAKVLLLDAVRSGAPPGTLHRVEGKEIVSRGRALSSHGLGVAEALELARALGAPVEAFVLHGIEADPRNDSGETLSAAVQRALPALCNRVEREVAERLASAVKTGAVRG
ncbi:MAG: hypothetical protein A2151_01195 [Candidatus Muproteobacteria bacterium RBG_16_65_34]|uniref:Hydrogenase maturation protease n=1 Tax=Candidatus Muproteobacteria bacterium RBG_16_65_34 TaxID=1817760 RepID=A0A1F6TRL3_9PROT|nr:MAG: hypothetical protein A2151_01195 [Candidatus Muproteobacteria bacterium RBG_16_65_34]